MMHRRLLALAVLLALPGAAAAQAVQLSPQQAESLDAMLQRLAEHQRPTRWCSGDCYSLFLFHVSGSLASGRLQFEISGQVTGEKPGLVSLFGVDPAGGLTRVRVGGAARPLLWHEDRYVTSLRPGAFAISGELTLPAGRPVTFRVPGPLGEVRFDVADAQVIGERRRRGLADAVFQLVPVAAEAPAGPTDLEGPSRVRMEVTRSFVLERDRRFETRIRVDGAKPGQVIAMPLLEGEDVKGTDPPGATVRDEPERRIEFTASDASCELGYFGEWAGPQLNLTAPEGAVRETWEVSCRDPFACTFEGTAENKPGASGHVWAPLPGQTLTVNWRELEPMPGTTALVQSVHLATQPRGDNLQQAMQAAWTASASSLVTIALPEGAVIAPPLLMDGAEVPVLKDPEGRINLTLPAGRSVVVARWEILGAGGLLISPPVPSFSVPVGTLHHAIYAPGNRSVLIAGGADGSPAVRLWPALATCLLLGMLLYWILRRGFSEAEPPRLWLWLLGCLGFGVLSPFALLPLLAIVPMTRWMGGGGERRHGAFVVLEILLLAGLLLALVGVLFAVLYQAFFSAQPVAVENFARFQAHGLIDDRVGPGLFWLANLAGAGQALPAPWVLTLPVLVFRLLWFGWAIAAGFLLYREGREVLRGVAAHWRRAWPAKE